MSGYHADSEKYHISTWLLGCIENEIDSFVQAERERIIKLLEDNIDSELSWVQMVMDCATVHEWMPMLIALIKGEK